jgi:hypothetical protein
LITFFCLDFGRIFCAAPGLVDHVDRLVRQMPVVDEARREAPPRSSCGRCVLDAVMLLETRLQALEDLDRPAIDRRSGTSIFWKRRDSA